jgi:2-dehydro-3-deoxy-D-arabinonate dehydratase
MPNESIKLFRTDAGCLIEDGSSLYIFNNSWDDLIARDDLHHYLRELLQSSSPSGKSVENFKILPPISSQEVWAAGVTYYRSRDARMEESKSAGGGDFYDRVYHADRPELFFKATAHRVVGHGEKVAIRSDATWSVPEPELALLISPTGKIVGYTIGNDLSSRDIEGENPLYLPQAKVYNRSCALGPGIVVAAQPPSPSTEIRLEILRSTETAFSGSTTISAMKRNFGTLIEYLYRDNSFPNGCFLLTGTGIVPPDSFTLQHGDEIRISITGAGTLVNFVG